MHLTLSTVSTLLTLLAVATAHPGEANENVWAAKVTAAAQADNLHLHPLESGGVSPISSGGMYASSVEASEIAFFSMRPVIPNHNLYPSMPALGTCLKGPQYEGLPCNSTTVGGRTCGPGYDGNVLICDSEEVSIPSWSWKIVTECSAGGCRDCRCEHGSIEEGEEEGCVVWSSDEEVCSTDPNDTVEYLDCMELSVDLIC